MLQNGLEKLNEQQGGYFNTEFYSCSSSYRVSNLGTSAVFCHYGSRDTVRKLNTELCNFKDNKSASQPLPLVYMENKSVYRVAMGKAFPGDFGPS